jgi:hypothetical protein
MIQWVARLPNPCRTFSNRPKGQPLLLSQINHHLTGLDRNRQRLLGQDMQPGFKGIFGDQMMHEERGKVIDRVDLAGGNQILVVGENGHIRIGLEFVQVDVGGGQRVAGGRIEDRRAWGRAFAFLAEHQGVTFFAGTQGGNPKIIDAGLTQFAIAL